MLPSKSENLSPSTKLIHVCKKLPLALDCRLGKYSQWICNTPIFQFWAKLLQFLSHVIFRSSSFLLKNSELIFAVLYFFIYELKKCLRFLKSYFKLEMIISGDSEIWDPLYQRSFPKLMWQSIEGKSHHWQKMEVSKGIHSAKLHYTNGDMPFFWVQCAHMFFHYQVWFYCLEVLL